MQLAIRDTEPTTSCLQHNTYHRHLPLFVMDIVRVFQDHPKYVGGLKEQHIIELVEKDPTICGDVRSQVKVALKDLATSGFVRFLNLGYRTLGPFAKLAMSRTPRQFSMTWERLTEMQKVSSLSFNSSCSSRSTNC